MIAATPHRSQSPKEAHAQGWLVSLLIHGTVALTTILLMKQVTVMPEDETFKWNVAMVSLAQPTASFSNQSQVQSVQSATSASSSIRRSAVTRTHPSPQAIAPLTSSEQPVSKIAAEPFPPYTTAPLPPTTHTIQPAEPIRHETVAPMTSSDESGVRQNETPMAVSTSTTTETERVSAQPAILEQATQSEQASAQTQVAAISPVPSNAPTKRDYGWLSEAIVRRVEELKRYPTLARVDRAEGKVVVRAVINEDGNLGEVEVFQSSGYSTLDKAAVETMRQAAPFHLPHPLGQQRMTIKIPMSYRLDR